MPFVNFLKPRYAPALINRPGGKMIVFAGTAQVDRSTMGSSLFIYELENHISVNLNLRKERDLWIDGLNRPKDTQGALILSEFQGQLPTWQLGDTTPLYDNRNYQVEIDIGPNGRDYKSAQALIEAAYDLCCDTWVTELGTILPGYPRAVGNG